MTDSLRFYAVGEILFFQFMPLHCETFSIQIIKHFMLHYQGIYSVLLGEGVYSSSIPFSLLTLHRSCVKDPLIGFFQLF